MNPEEKLEVIYDGLDDVFNAGYEKGIAQGGGSTHFWDVYQDYGKRTNYSSAFYGWDGSIFNPIHDMYPTGDYGADNMFSNMTNIPNMGDLDAFLKDKGITLDFKDATRLSGTFNKCSATKLPPIDLSSCTKLIMSFYNMTNLTELTLKNLRSDCTFDRVFAFSNKLVTLNITGKIGQNGFSLENNPGISVASLRNVLNALEDKSNDTSTTWILTLGDHLADLTDADKAIATGRGWKLE